VNWSFISGLVVNGLVSWCLCRCIMAGFQFF
jgi:hypothetical protein